MPSTPYCRSSVRKRPAEAPNATWAARRVPLAVPLRMQCHVSPCQRCAAGQRVCTGGSYHEQRAFREGAAVQRAAVQSSVGRRPAAPIQSLPAGAPSPDIGRRSWLAVLGWPCVKRGAYTRRRRSSCFGYIYLCRIPRACLAVQPARDGRHRTGGILCIIVSVPRCCRLWHV